MFEPTVEKKIVFVGDGESGQHSLLITICTGVYPGQSLYCDNEPFVKQVQYEGKAVNLTMHFTEGSETYDRIRPFTYKMADVAVIVFAVNKPSSFESIREKWAPEMDYYCKTAQVLLVGLKTDLRDEKSLNQATCQSSEQGQKLAIDIGAYAYLECSAKNNEGLEELIQKCAEAAFQPVKKKLKTRRRKCIVQ